MKKFFPLFIVLLLVTSSLFAQMREERNLPPFSKIKAGGSFEVFIRKGNEEKVVIEAKSGDLEKILTKVSGNVLTISTESSWWGNSNFNLKGVKVFVTYRELNEIVASGSGSVKLESALSANEVVLSSSGSGNLYCEKEISSRGNIRISNSGSGGCKIQAPISTRGEIRMTNSGSGSTFIEEINANGLRIENSGSGGIKVNEGTVQNQSITLSGSGSLHLGYSSASCELRKSGSGSVHIEVREELNGNSSGSGNIYIAKSNPRMNLSISGSGKVKHVD